MFRAIVLLGLSAILSQEGDPGNRDPVTHFTAADSILVNVLPAFDSLGVLDGYFAKVFTPICETDKCYAVVVNFYWDLMGRFQRYDTLTGEPLTKLDHEPFAPEDYVKLQEILTNRQSPLRQYKKEELVRDTRTSEIDGLTGATIQEVKDNVIPGAVYSCHTLWHLANGSVVDSLQKVTAQSWDEVLVAKLIGQNDQSILYFMIGEFTAEDFVEYRSFLLPSLPQAQGYYAKNAIEAMPDGLFGEEDVQAFFAKYLSGFNYFTQVALLRRLDGKQLMEELKGALEDIRDERNSSKNQLIDRLLAQASQ